MRVLVLGAAGYTGRAVTRALTARDVEVCALIRDPAAALRVRTDGASEIVIGDFTDVRMVEKAAEGADGIWFVGPRFMAEEGVLGAAIIDAAVRANVRRFVLSGVYHPTVDVLFNHRSKAYIEDHLYTTDLEFTVLQPARFMHGLLLSSWNRIVDDGVLADAFSPDSHMAYVDYRDVAEVAAIAFVEDRLVRGTFELSADGEPTLHDLAAQLGEALGRTLGVEQVELDGYAPAAALMRHPYSAEGFRRLRRYYDEHGFRGGNALVLRAILGREPSGFTDCFRALQTVGVPSAVAVNDPRPFSP